MRWPRAVLLVLLGLCSLLVTSDTRPPTCDAAPLLVELFWTNPGTKQATQWIPPDQRDSFADSIAYLCDVPGEWINDLDSAIVYGQPAGGGPRGRVYAKSVRGREGQPDSAIFTLDDPKWIGGHFDVTFKRTASPESCPSSRVYIGTVTGVELPPAGSRIIREEWFDVHGRRVDGPTGTGLNLIRWSVNGKRIREQKALVIRGRVPSWVRIERPIPP